MHKKQGSSFAVATKKYSHAFFRPVTVVCVVGPYRTGKSYLLNRLMGKDLRDGFPLGPTIEVVLRKLLNFGTKIIHAPESPCRWRLNYLESSSRKLGYQ